VKRTFDPLHYDRRASEMNPPVRRAKGNSKTNVRKSL
jgi:hypothetical protein